MKKLLFILILFVGSTALVQAQCDTKTYKDICIQKIPEYFVFSRSYALKKAVQEHEHILNRQKAYIIIADSYRTKIEIYRITQKGKSLVKSGSAYVSYIPSSTGRYQIKFTFEETDEFCGAAVLCFLR